MEVDLSSIASGYTIDRLAELLRDRGIKNFMVELGGEVAGRREAGGWHAVADRDRAAACGEARNGSGGAARGCGDRDGRRHSASFSSTTGERYSHIIDPATGRPVEHALASVTVAADTCLEADGWDTPLMVLGPERGREVRGEEWDCGDVYFAPGCGDGGRGARRRRRGGSGLARSSVDSGRIPPLAEIHRAELLVPRVC